MNKLYKFLSAFLKLLREYKELIDEYEILINDYTNQKRNLRHNKEIEQSLKILKTQKIQKELIKCS